MRKRNALVTSSVLGWRDLHRHLQLRYELGRRVRTCTVTHLCGLLLLLSMGPALRAQRVDARQVTLDNGLRLLLVERREAPTISAGWVARVGSVNERPGITGISHLFEHMMFKGTRSIGTRDAVIGQEIRNRQDLIRSQMEEEYNLLRERLRRGEISGNLYDPANRTPRLKDLQEELEVLYEREKEVLVKDELDQIYTRQGASGLNAFTDQDLTAYLVTIPSNKLELWFWLESDRLLEPVFREFYSERDVVREERRLRTESTPTGRLDESFNAMFWQSSPYSWPVVGWSSDVESITREQAEEYFATYYAPNNITAVLVGDFVSDEAAQMAQRYFGRIPRGEREPPEVITNEIEQIAEKRLLGEADTNPQVVIRFHTVPLGHRDQYALDVLQEILNGRTGRLYRSLVEGQDLVAGQPSASHSNFKYGGYFQLRAQVKEGRRADEVEEALLAELDRIKEEPVGSRELQKVKNQFMASSFRRLQNNFFLLIQLMSYEANGDWQLINENPRRIQVVTAEQIREVAERYFRSERRNVAIYLRKAGSQPEDPVLAEFPPQARDFIRQQMAQLPTLNLAQLKEALSRIQEGLSQMPEEARPPFQYLVTKIEERMAQLRAQEEEVEAEPPQ